MPYYKDQNQKKVPAGKIRYYFDTGFKGHRFRKRIICRRIEVHRKFAEWSDKCMAECGQAENLLFVLFEIYLEEYVQVHKSPKQYKTEIAFYTNRMKQFFENDHLIEIKRCHIEKYVAWRSEHQHRGAKASRSTLNKDINILSSFFSWCIRHDLYDKVNPCYQLRQNEQNVRHIRLNGEQIREIIEKSTLFGGLQIVVMLVVFAGLRKQELLGLTWSDLDFNTRRIEVRAENSKYKKMRSIPMPDMLYDYLVRLEHTTEKVVPISESTLRRHFELFREKLSFNNDLSVDHLNLHDLRHVYAQTLRDAGVALDDIMSFLGHSSPATTHARYAQSGGYDGITKVNRIVTIIDPKIN